MPIHTEAHIHGALALQVVSDRVTAAGAARTRRRIERAKEQAGRADRLAGAGPWRRLALRPRHMSPGR
jgi:hypothetical protein